MFGFKSKRVKRLEAENYALEGELRDLREIYKRMCESEAYHKRWEMKVVPIKCVTDKDIELLKAGKIINFSVNSEYGCTLAYDKEGNDGE